LSVRLRCGPRACRAGASGCGVRVSTAHLGCAGLGSSPWVPISGSLAQREEHPVEAREIPVRFRGEPPCRTGLTVKTPVLQTGHRGSIPRYGSLSAASMTGDAPDSYSGEQGPSPWRRTGESRNWQTQRLQVPPGAGSNPASPTDAHSSNRQDNALWMRESWFESTVSSDAAAHGCGSAFVPRVARVGTGRRLMCSYSNFGREAGPRCRMLRVRVPPSARCVEIRLWAMGQLAACRALISDGPSGGRGNSASWSPSSCLLSDQR
jgi:hypothetical protein